MFSLAVLQKTSSLPISVAESLEYRNTPFIIQGYLSFNTAPVGESSPAGAFLEGNFSSRVLFLQNAPLLQGFTLQRKLKNSFFLAFGNQ